MNAVSILGVVAAFSLILLSAIIWCARKGFLPCRREAKRFNLLSAVEKLLIALFVVGWMVLGGSKNDSTNSPPLGMMGPPMTMMGLTPTVVTEAETNVGYRVESIVEGNGIVPLVNATTNDLWRLRGGVNDAQRMENGEWRKADYDEETAVHNWYFPYRGTFASGLTVFANGEFRPNAKTAYFPKPFNVVLALVPQGRWGVTANGGPSLFMHELTPSNSLVLAWQNALYNRDSNCPTNFQAELFADGRFEYRYPDHTTRYAPVFPFDWDGDGLENSVDMEPLVAGADAHGANAEWYGKVCSNVFTKVELPGNPNNIPISLSNGESVYFKPGVNTNAYYFVDVVAEHGLAPVYFIADGVSSLGNFVVVAHASETNHVPLLIGATYSITSSVPITVLAPIAVNMNQKEGGCSVEWPAGMSYTLLNGAAMPIVTEATRLNGVFLWAGGCCTLQSGLGVSFQCNRCGCGGCCLDMQYSYEGYMLVRPGPSCGCAGPIIHSETIPFVSTTSGATVELGFDKRAVIFEDAYDNSPTNHIPLRSTEVILKLKVNGGIHGGRLDLTTSKLSRLAIVSGVKPSNGSIMLAPYQVYEVVSTNRGALASTSLGDIEVSAEFHENDSGEVARVRTGLTVYELELEALYVAPENATCHNRHVLGVGEAIKFKVRPKSSSVTLHTTVQDTGDPSMTYETFDTAFSTGKLEVNGEDDHVYTCPISKNFVPSVKVRSGDVEYEPQIALVEPSEVITAGASWGMIDVSLFPVGDRKCWPIGTVGEATLLTTNYIGPMTVSFRGIAVSEIPCDDVNVSTGCFTNSPIVFQSHTKDAGAGRAYYIQRGNFWFVDGARSRGYVRDWTPNSTNIWNIPIGWHRKIKAVEWPDYGGGTTQVVLPPPSHIVDGYDNEFRWVVDSRTLQVTKSPDEYMQKRSIDQDGTYRTEKFGHWISRTRWCRVVLDGEVLQSEHGRRDE